MCLEEIGLCAQTLLTILNSIVSIIGGGRGLFDLLMTQCHQSLYTLALEYNEIIMTSSDTYAE